MLEPRDFAKTSRIPAASTTARTPPPAIRPVPGDAGKIRIGADVTYRSSIEFNDANDTPRFIVAKSAYHGVLNTHVTWSSDSDRSEVTVWGKNVTDKRAIINNADLSNFFDTFAEYNKGGYVSIDNWNDPRTVGISFTRRF